jgi:hypothetical protein
MPSYEQILQSLGVEDEPSLFEARAEAGLPLVRVDAPLVRVDAPPAAGPVTLPEWAADALRRALPAGGAASAGIPVPFEWLTRPERMLPALAFAVVSRCPVGSGAFVRFRRDADTLLGFAVAAMDLPAPLAVPALREAVDAMRLWAFTDQLDLDEITDELSGWLAAHGVRSEFIDAVADGLEH